MSLSTLKAAGLSDIISGGTPPLPIYYQRNGAPKDIVDLVALSNKRFGTNIETLACRLTGCSKVPDVEGSTGWDCEHFTKNFPEIKGSRYWQGTKDWRWQHILADHEWSHLILVAVDFTELKLFLLTKKLFMNLMRKGIVTQQGGAGGQGCWFEYKKTKDYLIPIKGDTIEEIHQNMTRLFQENPCARDAVSTEEITNALADGTRVKLEQKVKEKQKQERKKAEKEIKKILERILKKVVKKNKPKKGKK